MDQPLAYPLEVFVEKIELPQRAKVVEGYYEPGDEDGNREFSYGEIIEIRRVICPFVYITFQNPPHSKEISRITVSTRLRNLLFRVVTQQEVRGSNSKPRVFQSVQELIEIRPNCVEVLRDQEVLISKSCTGIVSKGDRLRIIRVIHEDDKNAIVEISSQKQQKLFLLPSDYSISFAEVEDQKSYTLQELVDMAKVPRYLRLDLERTDSKAKIAGLPRNFKGLLTMERPQLLVEICRVLIPDTQEEEESYSTPILVPQNCDIRLEARESWYVPLPAATYHLSSLANKFQRKMPFVGRIVAWTEESNVLQNHVTRPGDDLVVYSRKAVDQILAHNGERYFLIPVLHRGCFKRVNARNNELREVKLDSMESHSFPFDVQYFNNGEYRGISDDHLSVTEQLTFDRLLKNYQCLVVAKIFGDVVGNGFHLPLKTKITMRMERRWKKSMAAPQQMSPLDFYSEEISGTLYNEIMESAEYEWIPAVDSQRIPKSLGRVPRVPIAPPRVQQPEASKANRPPLPLPTDQSSAGTNSGTPGSDKSDDEEDEHDYSYIDFQTLTLRSESMTEDDLGKGTVEIPYNGDISNFTAEQMIFFLKENHVPQKAILAWKREGLDGKTFAKMTDEEFRDRGLASPVIYYFRDRSKMTLVLAHL